MTPRTDTSHRADGAARAADVGRRRVTGLMRGDKGAITVVFAMCGSLMIASMCIALDTIDGGMTQSRMQSALDVATLSAAVDRAHYSSITGPDLAQWQKDARAYYDANMPTGYLNLTMPDSNFSASVSGSPATGETIRLSASGTLRLIAPVVLTNGSGGGSGSGSGSTLPDDAPISATNAALRLPKSTLELVMVLDNTGSMADTVNGVSKMAGLQSAARSLVTDLFAQSNADSYVGIVPFRTTVNVSGALPPGGTWLSPDFPYNPIGVQLAKDSTHEGWAGCPVEPRDSHGFLYPKAYGPRETLKFTPYYYNVPRAGLQIRSYTNQVCGSTVTTATAFGVPVPLKAGFPNQCGFSGDQVGTGIATFYDQLDQVVTTDRNGNKTTTTTPITRSLTQNMDCIGTPVTFLTTDRSKLNTAIDQMSPNGSTIIPTGLMWGWRMLSSTWSDNMAPGSGWISTDPSLPKPEDTQGLQRVMIVLTDGENQVGGQYSIPNDLYFNGLSGVGTNNISAPSIVRPDGTSLQNGTMDYSEVQTLPTNGVGYSNDVNTFQLGVCSAIKQSGVTIYAITFGSVSSTAAATMQTCATSGDYYHAPDGPTLTAIFQQIAGNLGVLRLTQ
jgi:Flp pilus assembly protein TadG